VHEEEGVVVVVGLEDFFPGAVLDGGLVQARGDGADSIEARLAAGERCLARDSEVAALAGEGEFVACEPAGAALDLGEAGLRLEVLELLARVEHQLQLGAEGLGMAAGVAHERDQVAVDVVDDLDRRRLLGEKHRAAAEEDFDVGVVRRDQREEVLEQATFAAGPADDGFGLGGHQAETRAVRSRRRSSAMTLALVSSVEAPQVSIWETSAIARATSACISAAGTPTKAQVSMTSDL